jgi:hypothetical protein
MAIDPVKPTQSLEASHDVQAASTEPKRTGQEGSRFGPAYVLGAFQNATSPERPPELAASSGGKAPGRSRPEKATAQAHPETEAKDPSAQEPSHPEKRVQNTSEMRVPFIPSSLGKTLAALPPMNPIGTASLTRLSLVKLIEPSAEKPAKP